MPYSDVPPGRPWSIHQRQESHTRLLGRLRVLLVDDDLVDRMAAQRVLANCELLVDVHEADGQEKALRALREQEFQCVLLDYRLPDGDAFSVIQHLKETLSPPPPVVILTRHGSESVAVELLKAGATDYLPKNELTASRIAQCIRNALYLRWAEEALDRAYTNLERRVDERTHELAEANRQLRHEMQVRRQAEAEAREHLEHLAYLDRVRTLGEMAEALAHELHQPLGAIANFAQGCRRGIELGKADLAEAVRILDKVAEQAERAAEIVRSSRRFTSRDEQFVRYPVDVNGLVHEIAQLFQVGNQPESVDIRFDLEADLPPVPIDRTQIQQVLLNLLRNALESMSDLAPGERRIVVRTARPDSEDRVEISVADHGCGLGEDQLERLFRARHTTKEGGMGLGLVISNSIVKAHGGSLAVRPNEQAAGVEFYFDLPVQLDVSVKDTRGKLARTESGETQ